MLRDNKYFKKKNVSFDVGVFIYFYIFVYVFSGLLKGYNIFKDILRNVCV